MFVKTQTGQRCRFPDGTVVTDKPTDVPNSVFLTRRLKDGSVVLTTQTQSVIPNKITKNKKGAA